MKTLIIVAFGSCLTLSVQVSEWERWLRDVRPEERIRAIEALAVLGSDTGIKVLINSLDDRDPYVRMAVRDALLQIGQSAIAAALYVVRSGDPNERISAANGLINLLGRGQQEVKTGLTPELENVVLHEIAFARCSEGVCLDRWIRPTYPPVARSAQIGGRVWASFSINQNGQPENVSVDGHPLLVSDVSNVVAKWRYSFAAASYPVNRSVLFEFQLIGSGNGTGAAAVDMIFPNHVVVVDHVPGIGIVQRQ